MKIELLISVDTFNNFIMRVIEDHENSCKERPFSVEISNMVSIERLQGVSLLIPASFSLHQIALINTVQRIHELTEFYQPDISRLNLLVRTQNILKVAGIYRLNQLLALSEVDLLRMPNMGRRGLTEIKVTLEKLGMNLMGGSDANL